MKSQRAIGIFLFVLVSLISKAQMSQFDHFRFIENKGQLNDETLFSSPFPGGSMNIYSNSILYHFYDVNKEKEVLEKAHEGIIDTVKIDNHNFRVTFLESSQATVIGKDSLIETRNYIKGNDPTKWVQGIRAYKRVDYLNIYPNTDLSIYQKNGKTKYEFIVNPGAKPRKIRMQYAGVSKVYLQGDQLVVQTTLGNVIEDAPFAYQTIGDKRVQVDCKYVLEDSTLSYKIGKYNKKYPLIIDPRLIFSTSSGSLADNWGNTACYDRRGNLYTGGTVFEATQSGGTTPVPNGFPTTLGAFQTTFQGGDTDMGIMKFDSSGTFLIYSTIIGGSDAEIPTSTVVNDNNELYILGTTASDDFPVTPGAFDTQFDGNHPVITWLVNGVPTDTGDTFNSTLLNPGDQIQAQLVNSYTCSDASIDVSNIITLKQAPSPEVSITSSGPAFCTGDNVVFNATVRHSNSPTYQWLLNGTPVGTNSSTFTHTTPTIGDSIQVVVTDASCNPALDADTSEVIVLFSAADSALSVIISDTLPHCTGGRHTFTSETNYNDPSISYTWLRNGTAQSFAPTYNTANLPNGTTIQLRVNTTLGCAVSPTVLSNIITINNTDTIVTPTITITPRTYSECDEFVILDATFTNAGAFPSLNWYFDGNLLVASNQTAIRYYREFFEKVSVRADIISSLGCVTASTITTTYQLPEIPTLPIDFTIETSNDTLCANEPITFQANANKSSSTNIVTVGGYQFRNGTDIVVIHLNTTGSAILNATYVGGRGNDGVIETTSILTNNYGDQLRGDINLDSLGNVYVASSSSSKDFPVVNAAQPTYGGGSTDGVVFKMNPTLSTMVFSTYLGGSKNDAAYSVQTNDSREVYVGGGTNSANFTTTAGTLHPNYQGDVDGFITHLSTTGNTIINSTLLGTNEYDQVYFVQLDTNSNVYALGQTKGNYPILRSRYSNPNSGLFVQKVTPDLSTSVYSTVIGDLNPSDAIIPNISPTAFLVNECENIFISGWGGEVNNRAIDFFGIDGITNYPLYNGGYTFNMPITPNAFQSTTDGSDFYLAALSKNADSLIYSTYFGGTTSEEHVDGGTSRFDFRGIVYQSVCSGCGANRDFPTFPDDGSDATYPKRNQSENCNNGVFKFDLATLIADFEVPDSCLSREITFKNTSSGGIDFTWDFGDGNSAFTPIIEDVTHTYEFPGLYEVMLIATDLTTCVGKDTATTTIYIPEPMTPNHQYDTVCIGETSTLRLITNNPENSYHWSPSTQLSNNTIFNPVFSGDFTTKYLITVSDTSKCVKIDTFDVKVFPKLNADFTTNNTCNFQRVDILNTTTLKSGTRYQWDFGDGTTLDTTHINELSHIYAAAGIYQINLIAYNDSTCNKRDQASAIIAQVRDSLAVIGDTLLCRFASTNLLVTQGQNPAWESSPSLSCTNCSNPVATPLQTTTYYVSITQDTCTDRDSVTVEIYPDSLPTAQIEAKVPRCYTDTVLFAGSIINNDCKCCERVKSYSWDFGDGTSSNRRNPKHLYNSEGTYEVTLTIIALDTVTTIYPITLFHTDSCLKNIYIPNAFSPNDDLSNDILYVRAINIIQLEFHLFNRWGEEVFSTTNKNIGWDGVYKGTKMSPQVFTYTCRATFWDGEQFYQEGNVTLLE